MGLRPLKADGDTVVLTTASCIKCGSQSTVTMTREQFARWSNGALMQQVLPDLTPEERELYISGTHPRCWRAMFGNKED